MMLQSETIGPLSHDAPAAAPEPLPEVTILRPLRGWEFLNLRELWRYRELVFVLAWRDVKVRYKQTVLGAAWAVLQPAMMMIVFTIFFNNIAGADGADYPAFVYAGLIPWTFFAGAVGTAAQSVLGSERLITKIYFPRLALPFAAVAAATLDSLIAFGLLVPLMIWYGKAFTWSLLLLPLIYVFIVLAAAGVGALLAGLHVSYRDFRYVTPFLLQLWMFATPTIYMDPSNPNHAARQAHLQTATEAPSADAPQPQIERSDTYWLLRELNPMTGLVGAFRSACFGSPLDGGSLARSATFAIGLFLVGCLYFRKVEGRFGDVI